MNIKELATQMLVSKLGGGSDTATAESALDDLIGQGDKFDLGDLVGQLTGSGGDLASKAKSWLGDGANEAISAAEVKDALGSDKVAAFADKLGVSREEASGGLSALLPALIDKSSRGGNLLDSIGGADGLKGLASKFLK